MSEFNLTVPMVAMHCCKCGIPFAVPKEWDVQRRYDYRYFNCPNGHRQAYVEPETPPKPGASLEDRQELVLAIHRAEQAEARAAEASGKPSADLPEVSEPATPTPQSGQPDPTAAAPEVERVVLRSPGGSLVCAECSKAYKYPGAMEKHLCADHGMERKEARRHVARVAASNPGEGRAAA